MSSNFAFGAAVDDAMVLFNGVDGAALSDGAELIGDGVGSVGEGNSARPVADPVWLIALGPSPSADELAIMAIIATAMINKWRAYRQNLIACKVSAPDESTSAAGSGTQSCSAMISGGHTVQRLRLRGTDSLRSSSPWPLVSIDRSYFKSKAVSAGC